LRSHEPRAPAAPVLRKEVRELATGNSLWVLMLLLSPLVGYSFIQAVALYAEASRPALSIPELARQLSPFDGILVPTLGGFYLAITLLFPFIAIRLVAAEKASGGLKLLVQLPYRLTDVVAAKFAALIAAWLIAPIPVVSALVCWGLLGGHLDPRETATLMLGSFVMWPAMCSPYLGQHQAAATRLDEALPRPADDARKRRSGQAPAYGLV
jgi:hypothetical protein